MMRRRFLGCSCSCLGICTALVLGATAATEARPEAKPGPLPLSFAVTLQTCGPKLCIPGEIPLKTTVQVQAGEPALVPEAILKRAAQKFPPPAREVDSDGK